MKYEDKQILVVKSIINNNIVIVSDFNGREVIAIGKGLGFKKHKNEFVYPHEVMKTYVLVGKTVNGMFTLFEEVPFDVIEIAQKIIDYASNQLGITFNVNLLSGLADHINFAIKRCEEKMVIDVPVYYDIQHLYPHEFAVGEYALKEIKKVMSIQLPKEEIIGIALHLINAKAIVSSYQKNEGNNDAIESITHIIESFFSITVERKSFNYSRFVSHIQYLLKRGSEGQYIMSDNQEMFQTLTSSFPSVYECAKQIDDYIFKKFNYTFNDEEILYLMLHINRLCAREDCYQ